MTIQFYIPGQKFPMPREFKPISQEYTDALNRRLIKVIPKYETTHDLDPRTKEIIEREAYLNIKTNKWEIRITKSNPYAKNYTQKLKILK